MILLSGVGFEFGCGEDGAEEEPRAVFARDKIGVLALPTETGKLRELTLQQRCRIDDGAKVNSIQFSFDEQAEFLKRAQPYPAPNADLDKKMQDLWTEMLQAQ